MDSVGSRYIRNGKLSLIKKKYHTNIQRSFGPDFKKNFGLKPGLFCCKKGPRPSPKMSKIEKTDSTEVWVHKKYVF